MGMGHARTRFHKRFYQIKVLTIRQIVDLLESSVITVRRYEKVEGIYKLYKESGILNYEGTQYLPGHGEAF